IKAKSAISSLHKLSPQKATVIEEDGTHIERAIQDIAVGSSILVKASQVVPLDGIVTSGTSSVNLVHLTGESFPVPKKTGDAVAAGAKNLEGALTLQITHSSADST
ncbi:MAG TPA: cation-transporting P-type ATPase, partial [Parachlamydiaceae bacterium]|nr:cation-transporting P-type ATPase [Parachlamydiaceae bacterium]